MKKLIIAFLTISALASCRLHDGPPKTDHLGPVPADHDGVFVCGADTLIFNGDGKTIRWSLSNPYDSLSVQGKGSYAFLLYNGRYRYDAAEEFSIYDGVKTHKFMMSSSRSTEDMISFFVFDDDDNKDNDLKVFKKIKSK